MKKDKEDHKETENHQRNFTKHLIMNNQKHIMHATSLKIKIEITKTKIHKTPKTKNYPKNNNNEKRKKKNTN